MKNHLYIALIACAFFAACDSARDKAQHSGTPRIIHGANEDKPNSDPNAMKDPDDRYSPDEKAQKTPGHETV